MRELMVSGGVWEQVYVGLDYATAFVQVCVLDPSGRVLANGRCENCWIAIDALVRRFGRTVRAAIEACNGAANLADQLVHHAGWSLDLADLVRVGYLPRVWLAPEAVRELRRLVRRRQDLVERRRALKLQVGAWLRDQGVRQPGGTRWTLRWRAWLKTVELPSETRWVVNDACAELTQIERRIAALEKHLAAVTQKDPMVNKLRGLRGLGLITACVIRAEIGDATRFRTGKQLAHYGGLTPRNVSSGLRQANAGLIQAGNRYWRATLMEAAHRLRRFDPRWPEFSQALEARGKKRCVAVAAVAHRWIRGLFHELKLVSRAA
jgi:transposase